MTETTASPSDINSKGWLAIAKRVASELSTDHVGLIAAGCAFYGLLAIFPGIVAAMALAGLFADPSSIVDQIQTLTRFIPEEAAQIVLDQAKAVTGSDSGGLSLAAVLGIGLAFYSASAGMAALLEGLNVAFDTQNKRGFIQTQVVKLTLTFLTIVGFLLMVAILVLLPVLLRFIPLGYDVEPLISYVRWPIVMAMLIFGLAVLYRYGPARDKRRWRWITPGAFAACILWLFGSLAFAFYVQNFASYNETFGALGGVIILLMWFWLSSYIILLGAEIDSEMEAQAKQNPTPETADPDSADSDDLAGSKPREAPL